MNYAVMHCIRIEIHTISSKGDANRRIYDEKNLQTGIS